MYLPILLLLNYFTFDVFAGEVTNSATDITEMRLVGFYITHRNSRIAQKILVENT
jgi:hypothetical protein